MPNPIHPDQQPGTRELQFTAVGIALGWRHSAVVGRRGDHLVTGAAAGLTRQHYETQESYVTRITDIARRYARVLGDGAVTVVAGMRLGAGGPRVRADLDRLREVHAAVHERLPDAEVVTPVAGERADYPAALTRRPAPRWLRRANAHPTGDRAALRTAWDATTAAMGEGSPTPSPSPHVDRSGRIPAPVASAGQAVGGGATAGAGSAPRAGHPTWLADALDRADTGARAGDTAELLPAAGTAELSDRLTDLNQVLGRRGRDYAHARKPLTVALHHAADRALADYAHAAARQRLPRRLSVTDRQDPRVLPLPTVAACRVEDAALGRPWLLQRVPIGEGPVRHLEWWHTRWRAVGLAELTKLPTLHAGKPVVRVVRGRREPTRLALVLTVVGWSALLAVTGVWVAAHLAELVICVVAVTVGLVATARRRHPRRWWPRP